MEAGARWRITASVRRAASADPFGSEAGRRPPHGRGFAVAGGICCRGEVAHLTGITLKVLYGFGNGIARCWAFLVFTWS